MSALQSQMLDGPVRIGTIVCPCCDETVEVVAINVGDPYTVLHLPVFDDGIDILATVGICEGSCLSVSREAVRR